MKVSTSAVSARRPSREFHQHKRVMAIMFCDLVGSTEMSFRLKVEDLNELLLDYRSQVCAVIESYGGFVARALGDGLLAYFGFPRTLPNDAHSAVSAALSIASGLAPSHGLDLRVRIGVAIGEVLVAPAHPGLDDRVSAVGFAVNLAAKLQQSASPGSVVVSASVFRAAADAFDFRDAGVAPIGELSRRNRIYEAVGKRMHR